MNTPPYMSKAGRVFVVVGLAVCVMAGCKKAAPPPLAAKPPVATVKPVLKPVATTASTAERLSVFEDLAPPQGRDPFYPDSRRREPVAAPVVMQGHKEAVASDLLLKGIVGSATHRLAVINSEILEVGEEARVRIPGGQVRLKVLEIGDDYAVIKVDGEPRTQRLVMEKKNY